MVRGGQRWRREAAAVLRGADAGLPVRLLHADDGKSARAEPVAVLFEPRKAKLAGAFLSSGTNSAFVY